MKLFAHLFHIYEDRPNKITYSLPAGEWREIPDEIANYILEAHPGKLCDVTSESNPTGHSCPKDKEAERFYSHRMIEQVPQDTMMKPRLSHQKRQYIRQAKKRSRAARLANA